jgi:CubicO group peptidase (beta-lactamase class C family)
MRGANLNRRYLIVGIGVALMAGTSTGDTQVLSPTLVDPVTEGIAPDIGERLDKAITEKRIWGVHGVVVTRHGKIVLERYFDGEDRARGKDLGRVAFNADTLHDMRSVSKSVVGLLYGIAHASGEVPSPEASLLDAFPEYGDLKNDPARREWKVHHALSMTMGTDWDELSVPYTDPTNSEIAMDMAPDRYRYVLGLPVVLPPGTRYIYNGGATALLARMIAKGSGKSLHQFARERLFDPIGAGSTEWLEDQKGEPYAASGLRMAPRDLSRIGLVMLSNGSWGGKAVLPASWISRCTTPVVDIDEMRRYGYHWYLGSFSYLVPTAPRWDRNRLQRSWSAIGNGGQRLYVFPDLQLSIAITAGNYDGADQSIPPTRVAREIVLPSAL